MIGRRLEQRETSFGSELANTREGLGESIEPAPAAPTQVRIPALCTSNNSVGGSHGDDDDGDNVRMLPPMVMIAGVVFLISAATIFALVLVLVEKSSCRDAIVAARWSLSSPWESHS